MAAPIPGQIFVSFGTNPLDPPVWTQITRKLISHNIIRGAQNLLRRFEPGRASFELYNLDRALEPDYAQSPYFPNVIPGKRIRYAINGRDRFVGFIESYSFDEFRVRIECVDVFGIMAQTELLNPYVQEVLADLDRVDSPNKAYYRFSEPSPEPLPESSPYAVITDSSGAGNHGTLDAADNTRFALAQMDPITDDVNGAIQFLPSFGANAFVLAPATVVPVRPGQITLACWIKASAEGGVIVWLDKATAGAPDAIDITAAGKVSVRFAGLTLTSATTVTTGGWFFVGFSHSGTTGYLVINNAIEAQAAWGVGGLGLGGAKYRWYVGGLALGYGPSFSGFLDEPVIAPGFIPPHRLIRWYEARNALLNQWSDERISWLLDQAGVSAGERLLALGRVKLQSASNMAGKSALAHLTEVVESEAGAAFVRMDGRVEFVSRYGPLGERARSSTVQMAFQGKGIAAPTFSRIVLETTALDVLAQVIVERRTGVTATVALPGAAKKYGFKQGRKATFATESNNDKDAQNQAEWLSYLFADPKLHITEVQIPLDLPVNAPALDLELWDRISVTHSPRAGGAPIVVEGLIARMVERGGAGQQRILVLTVVDAARLRSSDFWVWGVSKWGENTRWGWEAQTPRSATAWKWGTGAWGQTTEWG